MQNNVAASARKFLDVLDALYFSKQSEEITSYLINSYAFNRIMEKLKNVIFHAYHQFIMITLKNF